MGLRCDVWRANLSVPWSTTRGPSAEAMESCETVHLMAKIYIQLFDEYIIGYHVSILYHITVYPTNIDGPVLCQHVYIDGSNMDDNIASIRMLNYHIINQSLYGWI